ncbi:MAG: DUF167 family protein [Xanthobacteraceae bacterium]
MTRDPSRPWTVTSDGIVLTVRLTPKGGGDAIEGIDQMADGRSVVKARVRAAASEGEANAALVSLIARTLAVPPSRVTLIAGAAARIKRLNVMGDTGAIAAALERIMGVVK